MHPETTTADPARPEPGVGGGPQPHPPDDEGAVDAPGVDQPNVEEPGVEGPGADQPGDEEPGADRPGVDAVAFAWERWVAWAVVAACCGFVLWSLNAGFAPWRGRFGALLTETTTTGGDMGAHVWWPDFLRQHWFPRGRLSGWAPDWYAGFPVGQFYFPLPALAVVALAAVPLVPYDVAFKLVTVSGAVLLPAAAYAFGRGLRFPWPAPPLFAVAAVRYLFEVRAQDRGGDRLEETWTIYGGNLAGTLAGEFSFTIALALCLCFLGALARSLETGRRLWLPAVLLAATVLCHLIVAVLAVAGAVVVWLLWGPLRTVRAAVAVGGTAFLLTAVWVVPLLVTQGYTTSMRYEKVGLDNPATPVPGSSAVEEEHFADFLFGLPGWSWPLLVVAVVAAIAARRRSTAVLVALAVVFAAVFWHWPEHHVWNARFLPFYWLAVTLLVAVGIAEVVRVAVRGLLRGAVWMVAGSRSVPDAAPAANQPAALPVAEHPPIAHPPAEAVVREPGPEAGREPGSAERVRTAAAIATTVAVVLVSVGVLRWVDDNPGVARAWARHNYTGYEAKPAWPEHEALIEVMDGLGRGAPGRALWEQGTGAYGTTLALMLLPYWTDGRIGSMEGLYFESATTTPYLFLTVAELSATSSNPVRGLVYGSIAEFDLGVEHLQRLGVRYYLAHSDAARSRADAHPDLTRVAEVPDLDGVEPFGWGVYEVAEVELVAGLPVEPVVLQGSGGTRAEGFGVPPSWPHPRLDAWECAAAPWWRAEERLDQTFATGGPAGWARVRREDLAEVPRRALPSIEVTDVVEEVDRISFRVSEPGVPVVVRASYFPNWEVQGADGPWRLSPSFMVVVPTEQEVTLRYGLRWFDWLGRALTVLGLAAVVLLVRPPPWRVRRPDP